VKAEIVELAASAVTTPTPTGVTSKVGVATMAPALVTAVAGTVTVMVSSAPMS
jgi:hypothetical protein